MFNFQVTLSQLQCRKYKQNPQNQQIVTFRFGSIKLDLKMIRNQSGCMGGKRIVLELSEQQLQQMFKTYAITLFIDNQYGKFFSILSLQKLKIQQPILMHEIYFYNDQEEIIYEANFSFNLNTLKNPRLPINKDIIQNHKTFQEYFTKPPIPQNKPINQRHTLSSFLYGNKNDKIKSQKIISTVTQQKAQPKKMQQNKPKSSKTSENWHNNSYGKTHNLMNTNQPIYSQFNSQYNAAEQQFDINPPVMQFTNKQEQSQPNVILLQTQLRQLKNDAPQFIKFQTSMKKKNAFSKNKTNETSNKFSLTTKINQKLNTQQQQNIHTIENVSKLAQYNSQNNIKVDREQLRNKAKKQLEGYQSSNSIKIPIIRNGKYEYVDIADLNDEEIKRFAFQQKSMEQDQKQKQAIDKKLKQKQKQNIKLRKQLIQKQKIMLRQQQEVHKKQAELMIHAKKNRQLENQKKQVYTKQIVSNKNNYKDSEPGEESQSIQSNEEEYEQDFESESQAISQLKSRLSIQSSQHKKDESSYSYDSNDFQSFSQSLYDSQKKISQEEINDNAPSYKQILKKH